MFAQWRYAVVAHSIAVAIVASVLPALAAELPASLSGAQRLTAAQSPYELVRTCTIEAGAEVTIEAGVQIVVTGMYYLNVRGLLRARGTEEQPIVIGPHDGGVSGFWGGLRFIGDGHGELTHSVIRGATTNVLVENGRLCMDSCTSEHAATDGILVYGDARLDLLRSILRENGRRGLYVEGTAARGTVWRTDFVANGEYPTYLKATCVEILRRGNRYEGNGIQRVGVSCSAADDISDSDIWYPQDDAPFDLGAGTSSTTLSVSGKLTLDRGVVILGTCMDFSGSLCAAGTQEQPIVISSRISAPQPGDWTGIVLRDGAYADLLHTQIRHAETGIWAESAALHLEHCAIRSCRDDGIRCVSETTVSIEQTSITGNLRDGLRLEGCAPESTGVSNCHFEDNGRYPVFAIAGDVRLLGIGNSYAGNGQSAIGADCSDTTDIAIGTHIWTAQGVPLELNADPSATMIQVAPSATLAIGPGITIRGGGLMVLGMLQVNGAADNRVSFDGIGASPAPGSWAGLYFGPGSNGTLSYVDVEHAVHGVDVNGASPNISDCTIGHCQYDGLRFSGECVSVVSRTAIFGNGRYGVYVSGSATPRLGNLENADPNDDGLNDIWSNTAYEVMIASGNEVYAQNNYWGTTVLTDILARTWDHIDNPLCGLLNLQPIRSTSALTSTNAAARCERLVPLHIGVMNIHPTDSGGADIAYTVSVDADVRAEVRNIAGILIRTIAQPAEANRVMRLYWDGKSATGTSAPKGRYLCAVTAFTSDGRCCRSMTAFTR